ncbi:hypothetical protein CN918_31140 [Priestia megaterium]|nr:hypothetical protein CN918_31140 [Priestia megaterium]
MIQVMKKVNNLAKVFKEELELRLDEQNNWYINQFGTEFVAIEVRIMYIEKSIQVTFVDITDEKTGTPQITFLFPLEHHEKTVAVPMHHSGVDICDLIEALHDEVTEEFIREMIANDPNAPAILINEKDYPEAIEEPTLSQEEVINKLLAELWDYMLLYNEFGNEEYLARKNEITNKLRIVTHN